MEFTKVKGNYGFLQITATIHIKNQLKKIHTCPSCGGVPPSFGFGSSTRGLGASILAVPRTALVWTEISDDIPRICRSHSPSLGVTAQSALITTAALQFSHLFSFILQHLVFLELHVFLLLDVAVIWNCYIYHYCLLLPAVV